MYFLSEYRLGDEHVQDANDDEQAGEVGTVELAVSALQRLDSYIYLGRELKLLPK